MPSKYLWLTLLLVSSCATTEATQATTLATTQVATEPNRTIQGFTPLSPNKPIYGLNVTFPLSNTNTEPSKMNGFQVMGSYDPQCLQWRKFNIYFDGGFSQFWVNNFPYYTTLSIYSVAPVIRYTFKRRGYVLPYLIISIGASYLNHTRLANKNLGIHYAFQDRVGIGTFLGPNDRFTLGIFTVHYSNAHLSSNNSGITVPVMLDLGYRFQ